jgi:hypothetical protein
MKFKWLCKAGEVHIGCKKSQKNQKPVSREKREGAGRRGSSREGAGRMENGAAGVPVQLIPPLAPSGSGSQ